MLFHSIKTFYSECIGCEIDTFNEMLANKKDAYFQFEVPKKGGKRKICAINKQHRLYSIQKRLAEGVFSKKNLPVAVKGFVKGGSYMDFLAPHCKNKYFLRIDIRDFFGSITNKKVAETLNSVISIKASEEKGYIIKAISEICCLDGVLPQGAVTSPALSNLVFARIDQRITKYCQELNVIYTRYADDLFFSSKDFSFEEKRWFLRKIKYILLENGFQLNYSKTKMSKDEISLNGFVVGNSVHLSRKRLSDIVSVLRCCEGIFKCNKADDKTITKEVNKLSLTFRIGHTHENFVDSNDLCNYLCGYRSFLISCVRFADFVAAERLEKLIDRIEKCVLKIDRMLYSKN